MAYFYNMLTYTDRIWRRKEPSSCSMRDWRRGWARNLTVVCSMTEEPECIYTIIESENTLPDFDMIHKMVQWAHKHGLEPTERVYANDMTSFFAKDRTTYCLEIYMPFKRIASPV